MNIFYKRNACGLSSVGFGTQHREKNMTNERENQGGMNREEKKNPDQQQRQNRDRNRNQPEEAERGREGHKTGDM